MTREEKVIDILDKWEFFFGQRAGRELWADKPTDIQNQDIADFNRDVQLVRSALREQPHWISVTERLPERNEDVLCRSNKNGKYVFCGYRGYISGAWMENGSLHIGDVTHWMPLPEPPEVEV